MKLKKSCCAVLIPDQLSVHSDALEEKLPAYLASRCQASLEFSNLYNGLPHNRLLLKHICFHGPQFFHSALPQYFSGTANDCV